MVLNMHSNILKIDEIAGKLSDELFAGSPTHGSNYSLISEQYNRINRVNSESNPHLYHKEQAFIDKVFSLRFLLIAHNKIDLQKMEIQFEDTVTCMQCWGGRSDQKTFNYQNQIYCTQQQQYASNKSSKMSLKKVKNSAKPSELASSRYSQSQTHEKFIPTAPSHQQQYFFQRHISHPTQERPKSQMAQPKDIKVTFNRPSYQQNANYKGVTAVPKLFLQKKEEIALDETAKIFKTYQNYKSQLYETKKLIPGTRFSLQELSQMKESVYSICQGEEKAKVEQSTIMMDFFNPSASRMADFKLSSKLQQVSSVCSQRL